TSTSGRSATAAGPAAITAHRPAAGTTTARSTPAGATGAIPTAVSPGPPPPDIGIAPIRRAYGAGAQKNLILARGESPSTRCPDHRPGRALDRRPRSLCPDRNVLR